MTADLIVCAVVLVALVCAKKALCRAADEDPRWHASDRFARPSHPTNPEIPEE